MIQGNTIVSAKIKTKKKSFLFYFIILFIVGFFGFIIEKNISLPQSFMRPIGVVVITSLFYLAFFQPDIPLLALVIYLPFCRILVGDFGTSATAFNLTNILMFITMVAWSIKSISNNNRIFEKSTLNLPILAFIIWGILSLIISSSTYGSQYFEGFVVYLKRWLTPIILYFITFNMVKDKNTLKKVVISMMLVILIVGLMAMKDYLDAGNISSLDKSRVGGVFEQPNILGGFFVYNMFLFLAFFLVYFPNFRYWLLLIPFLVCFRGIQVTFSRGAYLGCAFGGVATTFFKSKILFITSIVFLIIALLNPVLLPKGIRHRMESTFYGEQVFTANVEEIKDSSAQSRIIIWKGAVQMIKDHPIFGVGYGLFSYFIPFYAPIKRMDAHNTYLILAAEMGIPALLIFLLILFIMIKNSYWLYKRVKDKFIRAFALGMLGGLFGLLVVNMFGSRLNSEEVSAYFWIYSGLIMAAVRMKQRKKIA